MHLVVLRYRMRDVREMAGETPMGRVCEMRSIPGGVVAWADDVPAALEMMHARLEAAFARVGSAAAWFAKEREAIGADDAVAFARALLDDGRGDRGMTTRYSYVLDPIPEPRA